MSRAEVESRPRTQNNSRLRADFSRTDPLQVKDRNVGAKYQGHRRKCSPKNKKKVFRNFSSDLQKKTKRSSQSFRKVSCVFQENFNDSNNSAVLGREQSNFRGLEASRARPRT